VSENEVHDIISVQYGKEVPVPTILEMLDGSEQVVPLAEMGRSR
jgi:hypothetical protein